MPEYLAPGVYVEEVSFRSKSIEGVSTTTTGFVGPTRYGPVEIEPDIITSLAEFEQVYGDRQQLKFNDVAEPMHNFMWHAVRAFFDNGGRRLYVSRVFNAPKDNQGRVTDEGRASARLVNGERRAAPLSTSDRPRAVTLKARFPGTAGKMRVVLAARLGQNLLSADDQGGARVVALNEYDVVWITDIRSPLESPPGGGSLYLAERDGDEWVFRAGTTELTLAQLQPNDDAIRLVTLALTVIPDDPDQLPRIWSELPPDPRHERAGLRDALTALFAEEPPSLALKRSLPLVIELGDSLTDGLAVLDALFGQGTLTAKWDASSAATDRAIRAILSQEHSLPVDLDSGNDGLRPDIASYEGEYDESARVKTGLMAFEDIEDISIVAAPGASFIPTGDNGYPTTAFSILGKLISHAERMRYRIAVLDSYNDLGISDVRALRAKMDSKYAAFYYPWVRILDPVTRKEIHLPPSGFVTGIYARNDNERAVYKAPANEVVNLAIGFESLLSKG